MSEYKVLKKPIPFGGKGRNLTSSECKALRNLGVSCSESYMVNRLQDLDYRGALYRPAENGYSSVGITVEMSDDSFVSSALDRHLLETSK